MALKPELRQNFTIDKTVLQDVADNLDIQENDKIIEIGPGKAVLTNKIITKLREFEHASLLSYEVDEDLRIDLESVKAKNIKVFDYRIQSFLDAKPKAGYNKCTGNIPYHISEPLLFRFIAWDFQYICMITGIKFARKVCGDFEGKIATICKYIYDSKIEKIYNKNIFFPKSKVDSALLIMKKKTEFANDTEKLLSDIFQNTDKKHQWLNKKIGFEQSQSGQVYHMDFDKLIEEVTQHTK